MISLEENIYGFFFRGTNYGTVALGKICSEDLLVGRLGVVKKCSNPKFEIKNSHLKLHYKKSNGDKIIIDLGQVSGGSKFIKNVNDSLMS